MKKNKFVYIIIVMFGLFLLDCSSNDKKNVIEKEIKLDSNLKLDTITFGGGCFWCVEAVFLELDGVLKVTSGYEGGKNANPTYEEVCSGNSGHAEVCQIIYDESKLQFKELLDAFFSAHDPTTLNMQGNDKGTQYRSVIFYNSDLQKQESEDFITALNNAGVFNNKIVTEVTRTTTFYKAENYHQNYYAQNSNQPYCSFVINPKLDKFRKKFKEKLKK
jgi:peptide-methionine (S)-S-oxide reductase